AVHYQGIRTVLVFSRREVFISCQDLPGRLQPVLHKCSLQGANGGTRDGKHAVAPRRILLYSVPPLIRYSCTAHECQIAVNHYQLAMRAVVGSRPIVKAHRVIPLHVPASQPESGKKLPRSRKATYAVEHQVHLHTGAGAFRYCIYDALSNLALLKDVRLPVNALLR